MMALDIIKLYVSLLSEFFVFSDMAVMTPPVEGSSAQFLPDDSNSFTTAHYLMKILTEIQDNVNEINSMEISGEMSSSLKGLLESARWGFEDVLTHAWVRGMFARVAVSSLLIPNLRRAYILLLGNLDALFIGTLHNRISVRYPVLSTATNHMGLQVCRRCRGFIILSDRTAANSQRVCDQDYQSVFRCYLCIL
jgi:hypothetical protein